MAILGIYVRFQEEDGTPIASLEREIFVLVVTRRNIIAALPQHEIATIDTK